MLDLNRAQGPLAELYELTYSNGQKSYFTNWQTAVLFAGQSYQAIPIKRTAIAYHSDMQSDAVGITFGISGLLVGGELLSIPQAESREWFKGAAVRISIIDPSAPEDATVLFDGVNMGGLAFDGGSISVQCTSVLHRLGDKFPRLIYSEQCNHSLFDPYCGLIKSAWAAAGTVAPGSTAGEIVSPMFIMDNPYPWNYFFKGTIEFSTGSLAGMRRTVELHDIEGFIRPIVPLPEPPAPGDEFFAYPGCDLTGATCSAKFNNYSNFLGFEFIPKPETIMYA